MTDEPLDLAKTIKKVAELPGLQSCMLSTTDGLKLAGRLEDPARKKRSLPSCPNSFSDTQSNLEELRAGTLETITLSIPPSSIEYFRTRRTLSDRFP